MKGRPEHFTCWMGNTHLVMVIDNYQNAAYKDTDDRGRVTLGHEHANATVAIAWSELEDPNVDETVVPSDEERDKLSELWQWGDDNGYVALDFDPERGRIYTQDAEWVDADVEGLADAE